MASLGQEAFERIRAREFDVARQVLDRAFALDPENAMLAHAKAHVCIDSGAFGEGAAYVRAYLGSHDPFNGVNIHTAWHLAYMELELGNLAAALDWHRRVVAPTLIPMTFSSAVSLLWRMDLRDESHTSLRADWDQVCAAMLRMADSLDHSPLNDLGRAMVFIATDAQERLADLTSHLEASDGSVHREVVRPLIEGLRAFGAADYASAVRHIEPVAPNLDRLSQFPDQLGVFHDTLAAARARL